MPHYFQTIYNGQLIRDGEPIHCPNCGTTRGLAICGYPGHVGQLKHCNHTFDFPRNWNARQALHDAIHDARRVRT